MYTKVIALLLFSNNVPKNQRSTAYCTALRHGDDTDWNFLWEQYGASNVAVERETILSALGCTANTTLLQKYVSVTVKLLNNLLNVSFLKNVIVPRYLRTALTSFSESRIRQQDISRVVSGIYSESPKNAEFLLDFVTSNTDLFMK